MRTKPNMLEEVLKIRKLIGNTPLVNLEQDYGFNLFAKLEYNNFSGSIKDRAANNILYHGIYDDLINPNTTIVESSSGNFGISTALHCNRLGIKFTAVVDPNINQINLKLLKLFADKVVMIKEPDETGGYLLNRIRMVNKLVDGQKNHFWTNQYGNENNYKGYAELANEIVKAFTRLDYLFVSTSSCGTITGLSKYVKQYFPDVQVIATDIEGSMIFSSKKIKRYIPGIGAGKQAVFLEHAEVDDYMILTHEEIIEGCQNLLKKHSIFAGGSSGACYYGAIKYLQNLKVDPATNAVIICPDRGVPYIDSVYNEEWVNEILQQNKNLENHRR